MNDDERLRRLLEDAVSDIEPRDSLSSIHARTKVRSMSSQRSWLLGAGTAAVAVAATVLAVVLLSDGGTTERPGFAGSPAATQNPTQGPTSPPASPTPSEEPSPGASPVVEAVPVYYVGDTSRGVRLYREFHRVDTRGDAVSAAVDEAVATAPDDPDYRTDWPAGTRARVADVPPADVVTVDVQGEGGLRQRPAGMSAEQARMAIQQLVYTAQAAHQSRSPVQLLLNGQRTDTLLGVPVSEPLAEGAAEDVLAQVWVIEPAQGAEVRSPFEVSGLAAAFEANVVWELRQGDTIVKEGFTTARACCAMEPYSFQVKAAPGEYTLVVRDTDPSGGEGFAPWEDTKQITVLP